MDRGEDKISGHEDKLEDLEYSIKDKCLWTEFMQYWKHYE